MCTRVQLALCLMCSINTGWVGLLKTQMQAVGLQINKPGGARYWGQRLEVSNGGVFVLHFFLSRSFLQLWVQREESSACLTVSVLLFHCSCEPWTHLNTRTPNVRFQQHWPSVAQRRCCDLRPSQRARVWRSGLTTQLFLLTRYTTHTRDTFQCKILNKKITGTHSMHINQAEIYSLCCR